MTTEPFEDREVLEEVRGYIGGLTQHADALREIAEVLSGEVRDSAEITVRRTSPTWLLPITAAAVLAGSLISTVVYAQASSRCTDDAGVCAVISPVDERSQEIIDGVLTATLQGVEFIGNGGTANQFLVGDAQPGSASVLVPEGEFFRIVHASGKDSLGRPAEFRIGKLAKDVFPGETAAEIREVGREVLATGVPQVRTSVLEGGSVFITRIYRIPGAVVFETFVRP